jgi:FG-GAP-like repeat/Divergent InlB B-repeat domain
MNCKQITSFILIVLYTVLPTEIYSQSQNPDRTINKSGVLFDINHNIVLSSEGDRYEYKREIAKKVITFSPSYSTDSQNIQTSPTGLIAETNGADISFLTLKKRFGVFGSSIGVSGINIADIDNDGKADVIIGGGTETFGLNNFWSIIEYSAARNNYAMKWQSRFYEIPISRIALFDINADGYPSIFVCQTNGVIEVYDGRTMEITNTIYTAAATIRQILFVDADNDASPEIVFCDDTSLYLYDPATLELEHQIPYGANDFKVGNVDSDPANEIVMSSGYVLELDGIDINVNWNYGGPFGYLVELSDIDNDDMEEIIAAEAWYYVTAFDADISSPKWQIPTDLDVGALLVQDIDNDGAPEVLYGDGQWGEIHCFDGLTGSIEKWKIDNPDHGVTKIAVYDTDQDGELEIVWGAGASSSGADHFYVHDIKSLLLEWQSTHVDGPFHALDIGDVDSDGEKELVFASFESNSGYDDGYVFVYNASTLALEWQSPLNLFGGHAWTGIHALKIGDVDGDGVKEIVIGTDDLYDGVIYVINGETYALEKTYTYDEGAPIYALEIADIDNDGQVEIIAGGGREHTGAPGVYIYVINGATGVVEWKSISLGDYWSKFYSLKVGDIDNDNTPEIVATNENIYVFDGITHQMWKSSDENIYTALDLSDMTGDSTPEIIAGTASGSVVVIEGKTYSREITFPLSFTKIDSLKLFDIVIENEGNKDIVFSNDGFLHVYDVNESKVIWRSEYIGPNAGNFNALGIYSINEGEAAEIAVGSNYNVSLFSIMYTMTANADGTGSGLVESNVGGISYYYQSASTAPSTAISYGTKVALSATADVGSTVSWDDCVGTGGTPSGNGTSMATCTFSSLDANKTATATFTLNTYTVTANATGNSVGTISSNVGGINYTYPGTITDTTTALDHGISITLTATAGIGSTVSWSGCASTGYTPTVTTCTISSLDANKTVTASFTLNTYMVTANATGNGGGVVSSDVGNINYTYPVISTDTTTALDHGISITLTATAGIGSTVSWSGCASTGGTPTVATCTISSLDANKTAPATFTLNTYTVTPSTGDNGSMHSPDPQTVNYNTTQVFIVTPDIGYRIDTVTGCEGSLDGDIYTTGAITSDCTVTALFSLGGYSVTPLAGLNGSMFPSTVQTVNHGLTTVFIIIPDTNYHIDSVTGCGGSLVEDIYTTGAIKGECSVSASFAKDSFPWTIFVPATTGMGKE